MWYGGGVKQRGFEKISDARLRAMNNHIRNLWLTDDIQGLEELRNFALSCEFSNIVLKLNDDLLPYMVMRATGR